MDIRKTTKAEMAVVIDKLSLELVDLRSTNSAQGVQIEALRAEIVALKAQLSAPAPQPPAPDAERFAQRYPLVDGLGRRYRIEQRGGRAPIKCFAPTN
jgi:ribosomal protein L29